MTNDIFDNTCAALRPLWEIMPPGPTDLSQHPAYLVFKAFCSKAFKSADKGLGFAIALPAALRAAGLPCMMRAPAVASSLHTGARAFVEAFAATTIRRRYLCPLDFADAMPELAFGGVRLCRLTSTELSVLSDRRRLARHYPDQPFDDRLAEFNWLIVEDEMQAPASVGQRALPFLYEDMHRNFGEIDPHASVYPAAVTDALFGLLLAPWEEWHQDEYDWRGFSIPWIHLTTDDIFIRPQPMPTADTLSWEEASYQEWDGEVVEYERPVCGYLDADAQATLTGFDGAWWSRIKAAQRTALFDTPVKHFLVRAALSNGMDELMAHMTTIEAALGLQSDFSNKGRSRAERMGATERLKKRITALLGDPQADIDYAKLFETRSAFVHGRSLPGAISSADRKRARSLARRVVLALIDAATGPTPPCSRDDYLTTLA
ncbi:hypothetical protein [Acetobacter sp.]|jgi:hypothetical protein|uniref:hypothetical protein n=1 Tax=Acetobacter sp. TaxID=440 RepID=UPI0025BBF636|nr:hypothetical protein [Acetobacter sp.]MCH4092076.1 hypothetical protein [Acetobacter sp.]MCI1300007.1 hypothetical protein [Acetobacter sp.]MCI1316025.1 hypothetical protein [Acetobacter sp.]